MKQLWPRTTTLPTGSTWDFTFTDPTGGPAAQLAVQDMLTKVCVIGCCIQ